MYKCEAQTKQVAVRISSRVLFLGILIVNLAFGETLLGAQPADPSPPIDEAAQPEETPAAVDDAPVVIDDPDKPWSQGISSDTKQVAHELFLEGNRLFLIPLFARAAEKYTAALREWKHPAFYFNLALAQMNLGQEVEARASLEQALAYGEQPLGAQKYEEAQKQLQEAKRHIGKIRVICRTRGAEVTLDGKTLFIGPGSYEGWIKAISHELTAQKAGYQSEARRVTILPERPLSVDLSLFTLTQATDISRRWAAWKPWLVMGNGVALLGGGGVLHTLSARNFNYYNEKFALTECAQTSGCTRKQIAEAGLLGRLELAALQQRVAFGAYMAGSVTVAAGIVLLYLNRPRLTEQAKNQSGHRLISIAPIMFYKTFGVSFEMKR